MRLIDADLLIKELEQLDETAGVAEAIMTVIALPTIDAEPVKHGQWIRTEDDECGDDYPIFTTFKCSECDAEFLGDLSFDLHYCPNCGAKMEVKEGCEKQQ